MLISVIRTVILYAFIMFAIRLMGKRQISDMQPSELVVTMVISDIASLPMQNTAQPLISGVVPVLILVSLELTVSVFMMKSRLFRRLVCGSPVVIIEDGKLLQKQLKRLRLTNDDLQCLHAEEIIDIALVDRDLASSLCEVYSGNRAFSSTSTIKLFACHFRILLLSDCKYFRLLSCLLMVRTYIDMKLRIHLLTKCTLRKHTLDCMLNNTLRMLLEHLTKCQSLDTADILGVAEVDLLIELLAGYLDLLCIYDYNIITAVYIRCKNGLLLSSQNAGDFSSQVSERNAFSVNYIPFALDFIRFRHECAHEYFLLMLSK